jgi:phosphoenolpyruvate-protein phosphotransferase (PTS system enzyme I)
MAERTDRKTGAERVLQGIGVSPGVVIGPAQCVARETVEIEEREIGADEVAHEIRRLEEALIETRRQIKAIQADMQTGPVTGNPAMLDAHLMVLDDATLLGELVASMRARRRNAEVVVRDVTDRYAGKLAKIKDDYLRERVVDIRDVARRVLRNLTGKAGSMLPEVKHKHIIVAPDLAPSDTAGFSRDVVLGFATDLGSPTSHTAVLARAMEIPAVVGLHDVTRTVNNGDEVLIDGNKGVLIVHPTAERLETYGRVAETRRTIQRELITLRHEPAQTRDGHRVVLSANLEGIEELGSVLQYGAEGIGLFRSEYLFLVKNKSVSESEQAAVYGEAARRLAPAPVIIRTLDLGGDKYFAGGHASQETNPFLGCRSIRLSLRYPEHFKSQLRAILRASVHGNVKIMYPMISGLAEVLQANALLEEAKQELRQDGAAFDAGIDVGVMIEIPSAALTAAQIAPHVAFFSIGTNDLVQYTLAVDRINDRVAYLYQPTHPAVLRLLRETVNAAHAAKIWVGLCGEMAADPLVTPLLVGLGLDELSVAPSAVPLVKDSVRSVTLTECAALRDTALACETGEAVVAHCRALIGRVAPELLELI